MKKSTIVLSLILFLFLIGARKHDEGIWRDALARMEMVGNGVERPIVRMVSRSDLTNMYFKRAGKVSEDQRALILNELQALYLPRTREIFIGEHLGGKLRDSRIFHEYIHYLQDEKNGRVDVNDPYYGADQYFFREMQAEKWTEEYLEEIN